MRKILLVLGFIFLTACTPPSPSGNKFTERNISQLQIGITTTAEAELILEGKPYLTTTNTQGTFLTWLYPSANPFDCTIKIVKLQFINNKLVRVVPISGFSLSDADRLRLMPIEYKEH